MITRKILLVSAVSALGWPPLFSEQRMNLERAVDQCYEELINEEMPERCPQFFGDSFPLNFEGREVAMRGLCKRRVYLRYLNQIPGFIAREMPAKDPECAKFWVTYEGVDAMHSAFKMLTPESTIAQRAAFAGRMLRLLEKLHAEGFSHGIIYASSFTVQDKRWFDAYGRLDLGGLVLGSLMNAKSIIDSSGQFDMEGLIAVKQDLYMFWKNIVEEYFPQTAVSAAFLADMEKVHARERNFDYEHWKWVFHQASIGQGFLVVPPTVGSIAVIPTQSLVGQTIALFENCRQGPVCIPKSGSKFTAETLGKLRPMVVAGVSDRLFSVGSYTGSNKYVKLFQSGPDAVSQCWQESVLKSLDGLHGYTPKLYRVQQPVSMNGCSVVEVFRSMIDVRTMFSPENRILLYKALASAIRGLELMHRAGFLYLGFELRDGVEFLADGAVKFTNFQNVVPYVDNSGIHMDRSTGRSRKVDLASLARVTATIIGDRDPEIDELIFAADALGWEDRPNYEQLVYRLENGPLSSEEFVDLDF